MKMTYGDGSRNPKLWNTSCDGFPPLTPLDIIAHEITHGITEYSAGLIYSVSARPRPTQPLLPPSSPPSCHAHNLWQRGLHLARELAGCLSF